MKSTKLEEELFYQIGLLTAPNIGDGYVRKLVSYFGSAKAVCDASLKDLKAIEGLGQKRIHAIKHEINTKRAEEEMRFIEKHSIQALFFTDPQYPKKLLAINDAPSLLFYKGTADLNAPKQLAVIGSRKYTEYGKAVTEELVQGLQQQGVSINSGLAFGIDIIAHRKALLCGLPTVGVLAHGLDRIYPDMHKTTAKQMLEQGGLLTEYMSQTNPDKQNFPMRNRIVAGMSDATLVIETDIKGGAMITAKLATGYNRDVFAVPGRTTDTRSQGCNYLIRTNIAQLITSAEEIIDAMNWEQTVSNLAYQQKLFQALSQQEQLIVEIIKNKEQIHIDELQLKSKINSSELASLLLNLEFQNIINSLPGKRYRMH